jgi:hypothetical protein
MTPEQKAKLADMQKRIASATTADELRALRDEAAAEVTEAGGISYESARQMADLLERGITWELMALVRTAEVLGTQYVPVEFIRAVAEAPKATVKQYWEELNHYDGLVDYGVPDDLSELEGL